jgi:hypothetical protein
MAWHVFSTCRSANSAATAGFARGALVKSTTPEVSRSRRWCRPRYASPSRPALQERPHGPVQARAAGSTVGWVGIPAACRWRSAHRLRRGCSALMATRASPAPPARRASGRRRTSSLRPSRTGMPGRRRGRPATRTAPPMIQRRSAVRDTACPRAAGRKPPTTASRRSPSSASETRCSSFRPPGRADSPRPEAVNRLPVEGHAQDDGRLHRVDVEAPVLAGLEYWLAATQ